MTAALAPVLDKLAAGNDAMRSIHNRLRPMVDSPRPTGTMAAWFAGHNGAKVTTVQVNNQTGHVWTPTGRVVDARTYKGKVLLGGSARDYKGMRVIAATDSELIVSDDWHTVAYLVES